MTSSPLRSQFCNYANNVYHGREVGASNVWLSEFSESNECFDICFDIISDPIQDYEAFFACNILRLWLKNNWNDLISQRSDLSSFYHTLLSSNLDDSNKIISIQLCRIFATICALAPSKDYVYYFHTLLLNSCNHSESI